MVEQAGARPGEAETSVAVARAQFVSSLGRRLEALRLALATVEQNPRSAAQRDHLRRRIHAFGAAAGVLGFDRVFEAFREAEVTLGRSELADDSDLVFVARTLDLVPSLVLGADVSVTRGRAASTTPQHERRGGSWPTSVLVFAAGALAESLGQTSPGEVNPAVEVERTEDPERAEQIVRILAPDVAVIDADHKGARELMETLVYDPLLDPVRIVAIGTFDRPEAAATLVALGVARVLPKPVSPDTLRRSVVEVSRERALAAPRTEPIGDQTIESFTERLAQEFRRGLVDSVKAQSRGLTVSFGEGTDVLAAVWASVARVRELVTLRSGGAVRFDSTGPEGAIPLVPWMSDGEQRALAPGERRGREDVSLSGRVIVVVDDDPAVAWFLTGLFRAAGAEAYEAHDGNRALEIVRDKWPDLVVSDILMPGLDGFSLCREIKRDIVLADTPVILLSWKEDLLQRVRELGVEADGYLRKEAAASVVVQRVREVLLPRARVEARMSANQEARGRLDGLTPRLVLELATKRVGDARVTIRDAGFLYEAQIRGGRLRSVSRTTLEGRSERGERVLSALLGVRAGRFAIQPDASGCASDFSGELREILTPIVERARAAHGALSDLSRVARIDVDTQAFEPYSQATPEPAREILRRLAEGASPDALVLSGMPVRLVESVLGDLVRHGAVRRIVAGDGSELFPKGLPEGEAVRARAPALKVAATGTPVKGDMPSLRAVPTPARAGEARTPSAPALEAVASPKVAPPPVGPPRPSPTVSEQPPPIVQTATVTVGEPVRKLPLPAGREAALPAAVPPAATPPGPVPVVATTAPTMISAGAPPLQEPASPALADTMLFLGGSPAPPAAAPAAKPEVTRITPDVVSDVEQTFAALLSDSIIPPPPPSDAGSESLRPIAGKNLAPPTSAPREASPLEAALRALPTQVVTGPEPAESKPDSERKGVSVAAPTLASAPSTITSVEPEAKTKPEPLARKDPQPNETPAVDLATLVVTGIPEAPPQKREEPPKSPSAEPPKAAARVVEKDVPVAASPAARSGPPAVNAERRPASSREPAKGGDRFVRGVVVLVIAAGGGYALMTALKDKLGPPEAVQPSSSIPAVPVEKVEPLVVEPTPSAVLSAPAETASPSPSAAPAGSRGFWPVQDLELPVDVSVLPDRGLLEIDVSAPHSIYVDGVFIGRGPARRIPLREGSHEVRVRGDGIDAVQAVEVKKGRRARLGPTNVQ